MHEQHSTIATAGDWLRSLAWDGTPRIGRLFPHYFGSPDDPFHRLLSWDFCADAAGRALTPGRGVDYVIVLSGPPGCGKSRAIEALSPSTTSPWLIEFPIERVTEDTKAYLARRTDRRHGIEVARPIIFIGTAVAPCPDTRRLCPIEVGEIRVDDLRSARNQLWAEAAHHAS